MSHTSTSPVRHHRCPVVFSRGSCHPRWKIQKALHTAGIPYEIVTQPALRRNRADYEHLTGQTLLGALEFDDPTVLREDSAEFAARITEGRPPAATRRPAT